MCGDCGRAGNDDVTTVVFAHAGHSINDVNGEAFSPAYWKTMTRWLRQRFQLTSTTPVRV